ncbi:serine/threonine-protein kinase Sgk1-like isoform X2 [Penaeus monodon]|uniref:serine/threonine-protein kinase Sgk1-like isoform X2 n=1 Tax=Penaeus monodon TaxID=6687 RepID=UPI0018A70B38|nr:serine/threonine-protein kinase Sgk1-like isoform X2 [Penaeus monodon]
MSNPCDPVWKALCALKDALISPCSSGDDDQPLAESSNASNISITSSNLALDDHVIEHDLGISNPGLEDDGFTAKVLAGDATLPGGGRAGGWRPMLRFHDQPITKEPQAGDSGHWTVDNGVFSDVDLGDGGDRTDGVQIPGAEGRTDSRSTTRESGYGRSLDDSNGSSSQEPSVSVAFHSRPDPGVFKVVVEDVTRCWFVLRRYQEFLALQDIIKLKVHEPRVTLPLQDTAERTLLNSFIRAVMGDPRIVAVPEVREFLQLDRFRRSSTTDTSSSSSDSAGSPDSSPSSVVLDPRRLMPPLAPALARKQVSNNHRKKSGREDDISSSLDSEKDIDLGCTKKSLTPGDFEFLSVVGKGSFGRVMLARYRQDNKVYAVKVLNKKMIVRRNETAHVLSERSVLIQVMEHPYLVTLHFAFTTHQKIFFVLDYVNGGELFFHLQRERVFMEPRAKFYAAEICCALTYMHTKGIVYRDLKPENILLDTAGHIVLTDFGLCKEGLLHSSSKTSTFCGTPEYLAPEILKKQPYSRAVDWWTLGAVLYEMLYGLPPFYSRDTHAMYSAILTKPLKLKATVSKKARGILEGLLQKDPRDRLGAGLLDGEDVKKDDFFKDIDWDKVEKRAITPPFVPSVSSETDTRNVDPMFTKEAVIGHSPASPQGLSASVQAVDHVFQGFSYAPPLDLDDQWEAA